MYSIAGIINGIEPSDTVFAVQFHSQILDHLLVNQWIDVFAQLVQHKPIADMAFGGDVLDVIVTGQPCTGTQQIEPHFWHGYDEGTVYQRKAAQNAENDEPEPQEHVDFLVDNV